MAAKVQNSQKPLQLGKVLLQPVLDKALEEEVEVLDPDSQLLPPLLILRCSHIGQTLISKYNNHLLRTQFESEISTVALSRCSALVTLWSNSCATGVSICTAYQLCDLTHSLEYLQLDNFAYILTTNSTTVGDRLPSSF